MQPRPKAGRAVASVFIKQYQIKVYLKYSLIRIK